MSSTRPLLQRVLQKLKRAAYSPLDTYDLIAGNRPPDRLIFTGDGSWRAVGNEFLGHFKNLGGLEPGHKVLDVGSGVGRMAMPLTRYLRSGSYVGFDIVQKGVEWCQRNITTRFPRFSFLHANIINTHYNPGGTVAASAYVFPFEDASFDFVFLTSVFTHMFTEDMLNYLSEISRVMRPGGRCLITYFVMNEEAVSAIKGGRSALPFTPRSPGCYTANPEDPEFAIGFDEGFLRTQFTSRQLSIRNPIHYGSWCGRRQYLSFQDIIIATKE